MYTMEELKAAADRLAAAGTPYLGKTLYEGEGHKVVVRPYFSGARDRGLFYLLNRDGEPYSDKYVLSDLNTGASEELETYIEKGLPIEIERWVDQRETREREAREEAAEAERIRFHGFTDGMTPMQKGRVVKCLDMRFWYANWMRSASRAEFIEDYVQNYTPKVEIVERNGKKEYRFYVTETRFHPATKTEYDYFKFLKANNIIPNQQK